MADQRPNRGRARGRARAKPLLPEASAQAAAAAAAAARPKEPEQARPSDTSDNLAGSGRGMQRGSMRARDPGLRADAGDAARGIGRMTLSGRAHVALLGRKMDPAIFDPATRPEHIKDKRGREGTTTRLITNYFRLDASKSWRLFQYRVDYEPEIDHKGVRKGMLRDHKNLIGSTYIFDGSMLYTLKKLPEQVNVVHSQRKSDESVVKITIALTNDLPPNSPICIQLYNIIFRSVLEKVGMKQVGRHYYDPTAGFVVNCDRVKLELWPGFITSILRYENDVMLCAEISHKLMRHDTVLDVIEEIHRRSAKFRSGRFHEECEKFLLGQVVLTKYNNKTYRVDGIEWDMNVSGKFQKGNEEVSYLEYYEKQYGIGIKNRGQPLLLSRPKKKEARRGLEVIHLVPELCTVTGLSDEIRSDMGTMRKLAQHTKQGPVKRVQALTNFMRRIYDNQEVTEVLDRWGLRFDKELVGVTGRVLPVEKIMFGKKDGDNRNYIAENYRNASWDSELQRCKLLKCVSLRCWRFVCLARDNGLAQGLIKQMLQVSRPMGFDMAYPDTVHVQSDRYEAYRTAIQDIVAKICCLLPTNRKDRYDGIKKLCCVDLPIPTQVVLNRTISKEQRLRSVATKIAIQINCKLGGEAWAVHIPLPRAMIIGIDTYHDSAQKGQSVGGFVASINKGFTRWYSNTTFQQTGAELIDGLKRCMSGALKKFQSENGALPSKIFVFRDGVGDGQLDVVRDHEVPQLLQCLEVPSCPDYKPELAYIVVKKRINTRLFMRGPRELMNPSPGTVVDDIVTRPEWYDFFIVSQSVREGTVSPTHYNVIYDQSGLSPNNMQRLAYKLCHDYFNWPGTVRVPAPCLYAHKLAFLVGQSIHRQPAPGLADKLYFL